jgi:2-desacetyl-2-hydroxyethyl bacteriochlorophyllide A dehydrogenase
MKAAVMREYGSPDVLKIQEIEKPVPKDNEILIRVHASSIGFGDLIVRDFKHVTPQEFNMPSLFYWPARMEFGFNKPKVNILGAEFAGKVEGIGKDVRSFKVGDEVFGYRGMAMGANAEYLLVPENSAISLKPKNMSFEEAATIPYGGLTAISLLRKANIQQGQKVLINGASGGIGAAALQLAKAYGADVTAVCGTNRMAMVKALGADKVIDYSKEDFTKGSERYDLVFDVLGRSSFDKVKHVLKPNGILLFASFKSKALFQMLWTSRFSSKKVICAISSDTPEDLVTIKEMVEAGKIKAYVDRCYPLEEVAAAHRYLEAGQRHGNVVLTL